MKMNKNLKIGLKVVSGIAVLFVAILIYHIATAKPAVYENANLQVSRIDFKTDIDSVEAKKINHDLRTINGITSDAIIIKRNVVVYFHNNKMTDSKQVYAELMSKGTYDARRFILPENLANKEVCPMDPNSFTYRLSQQINHFFN